MCSSLQCALAFRAAVRRCLFSGPRSKSSSVVTGLLTWKDMTDYNTKWTVANMLFCACVCMCINAFAWHFSVVMDRRWASVRRTTQIQLWSCRTMEPMPSGQLCDCTWGVLLVFYMHRFVCDSLMGCLPPHVMKRFGFFFTFNTGLWYSSREDVHTYSAGCKYT